MLKVQVAELNRTAAREFGSSFLFQDGRSAFSSNIGAGLPSELGVGADDEGIRQLLVGTPSNIFGVFNGGNFTYFINALRRNGVLRILAEPNLVAYHGQEASFLAGGEFPIPVPQGGAGVGAITIEFKQFGVSLSFVPYIIDGDTIRLAVAPEVSTIDFSLGTTILGTTVPGINTRRANAVVEMSQGQTLAMAGLLQLTFEGETQRIPIMGDLPYIGPFFSNNNHRRTEKELVVLVTPYLVSAVDGEHAAPLPGDELEDPNDMEFYFLGRIEGRTGKGFRATTHWDDPFGMVKLMKLHGRYVCGPHGHSP
jgi:pilus assembly protein CpaC